MKKKGFLAFFLLTHIICINAQLPFHVYYGNLHSHTSFSDGQLTPLDAYNYARDSAGLDFLAVTDHLQLLDSTEFVQMRNMASQASINNFVAIFGYEWSSGIYGHVNVFNTKEMAPIATYSDWDGFLNWLSVRPDAFAQFNHPGRDTAYNNWLNFEYKGPVADGSFPLLEFQNVQQATNWYELALKKGWHLSPLWNQDNHAADWGNKNNGRAGVWAANLSGNSLFDAIRAGRTFATMDKNASVWIEVSGSPMGQTIYRFPNMPLEIKLNDADNEAWLNIELVTSSGVIMSFPANGNIDTIIPLTLLTDSFVFVRAIQADSDYIWSGPIYFNGIMTSTGNDFNNNYKIYPNPANQKVCVEFAQPPKENTLIKIITLEGKLIKEVRVNDNLNNKYEITLPEYIRGLVLVEIENNGVKHFSKIAVVR